jgi:DNA ligase (NAD+)
MVRTPADIYRLRSEDLAGLERMAEKVRGERRRRDREEQDHDPCTLHLRALASGTWAEATAKDLARHFGGLDALLAADETELLEVRDVGPVLAESIARFLAERS